MKKYFDYKKFKIFRIESVLIITGIFLLLLCGIMEKYDNNTDKGYTLIEQNSVKSIQNSSELSYPEKYERQIEKLLSKINGLGSFSVAVYVKNEGSLVPAFNTNNDTSFIEENNVNGDTAKEQKNISENNVVVIKDAEGNESVFYTDKMYPEIEGIAICVQDGVSNVEREKILTTLMALYNISSAKISILG